MALTVLKREREQEPISCSPHPHLGLKAQRDDDIFEDSLTLTAARRLLRKHNVKRREKSEKRKNPLKALTLK